MANSTTRLPNRGDIVARTLGATHDNVYFKQSDFALASLTPNTYEILGVVAWRFRDQVLVVFKKNVSKKWCGRAWWNLTGYTLDGSEHTGIISIRVSTDSWAANVDKTITYTANTVAELVAALNAAFAADTDFTAQDWYAEVLADGTTIRVHCNNIDYRQCSSNTAKSGFAFTGGSLPEIAALANMRRKNGGTGAYGASGSFAKYIQYYGNKAAETLSGQSPIKTTGYPIAKATYIANANGYCDTLIARYGSGETGWLKYMKSCKPVRETDYGNHGMHDGKERTRKLASFKYTSTLQATEKAMCDAADYCYNLATKESLQTVEDGEFWLPTTQELDYIMQDVVYGTTGATVNSDVLNAGLNKINGSAISNGSYWWTCLRYFTNLAWYVYGYVGYFAYNYLYSTSQALPVSLFKLK